MRRKKKCQLSEHKSARNCTAKKETTIQGFVKLCDKKIVKKENKDHMSSSGRIADSLE